MSAGLPMDISALPIEVQQEFLECRHAREVALLAAAEVEARGMAQQLEQAGLRERRSVEGLGAPVAEIPRISYDYWGRRLGYQCWHDKAFVAEYLRDNPEARVKAKGVKEISVGYVGPQAGGALDGGTAGELTQSSPRTQRAQRFSKSYGVEAGRKAVGR